MRQASITSYLGPALVLYLVADVAAARGSLQPIGIVMASVAVLLSFAPLLVSRRDAVRGSLRLAFLGVAAGLSLVRYVDPAQMSMTADLARAVGLSLMGALVIDFAVSVPDNILLPAHGIVRRLPLFLGLAVLLFLGLSLGPPLQLPLPTPVWIIIPPVHRFMGELFLALCLQVALVARLARRALRSAPEALASNAWGTMCLVPSAGFALLALVLALLGQPVSTSHIGPALALVSALLVFGHARLIAADHRLRAGTAVRSVVALGATIALLCSAAALVLPYVPRTRLAFGFAMAASLFGGLALHRFLVPATDALLAPFRGTLLRALVEGTPRLSSARRLEELAQAALGVLRMAAGDVSASPRLYFFDPPIEARIDAAGQVHLDRRELNGAIAERLRAEPGELIMRGPLERLMVRQPTLRPLIEGLVHLDAMCVVPLMVERELEGALVLPRAQRRSALTLEESEGLRDFAERTGAQATILLSEARAQRRAGSSLRESRKADERLDALTDEVRRLRADAAVLRAGRAAHQLHVAPIAYSETMRRLLDQLAQVANADAPVFLEAEGGSQVQPLAFKLHERSSRAHEAFVIGDCGAVPHRAGEAALFGHDGERPAPGWLRLTGAGTLVLLDIPALALPLQAALSEAIATRRAFPAGGGDPYTVSARIVACARLDVQALADGGRFDERLWQRLSFRLRVPPLRERRADLESLLLLAIDRACRLHARAPVGLDPEASTVLKAYGWPGNQGELSSVIERAVSRCKGRRIGLRDLPESIVRAARDESDATTGTHSHVGDLVRRDVGRAGSQ